MIEGYLVTGLAPALHEAFSCLAAAGQLQAPPAYASVALAIPSSRDPAKRTAVGLLIPDRPCWPELVVTSYEKDRARVHACPPVLFGVDASGPPLQELTKFLDFLASSGRAATVRLDAATKAYVDAQAVDPMAPALVVRPFYAPRAA
mmetsp:Transcript_370/g.1060  ORF Transcript_370/g.1060 Transcript_370/m.1060 type:complete len:147 (-) Transcript_370:36-476(-)